MKVDRGFADEEAEVSQAVQPFVTNEMISDDGKADGGERKAPYEPSTTERVEGMYRFMMPRL